MPKPKIHPPRAITGSNGDMSGLRAAEVPPDSDSEGEPALPVLTSGQVVVAAAQPQVLLPWEQGVFRGSADFGVLPADSSGDFAGG